jgi:hypothetical protein
MELRLNIVATRCKVLLGDGMISSIAIEMSSKVVNLT